MKKMVVINYHPEPAKSKSLSKWIQRWWSCDLVWIKDWVFKLWQIRERHICFLELKVVIGNDVKCIGHTKENDWNT